MVTGCEDGRSSGEKEPPPEESDAHGLEVAPADDSPADRQLGRVAFAVGVGGRRTDRVPFAAQREIGDGAERKGSWQRLELCRQLLVEALDPRGVRVAALGQVRLEREAVCRGETQVHR